MLKKLTLSLLISASLSAAANANWFVGGGIGHSNFDYDQDTASATTSDSVSSVSGKLFGGYQFNDYFALQLNFAGLGGDYQVFGNDGEAVRLASASISAVGLYPLGDSGFSLLGSVGAGGINLGEVTRFDGAYTFEGQTSKLVTAEVGVRYVHPSYKNWRYDLSYEGRFFDEQNYQTDTDNIRFKQLDTLWLGVSYAF